MATVFYRKTGIKEDGYLDATYTDISDGQNTSVIVSSGNRRRLGYWNVSAADVPSYGAATLAGLKLFLYANETKVYGTPTTLDSGDGSSTTLLGSSMKLYRAKQYIEFNEGDTVPANEDIMMYSSVLMDQPLYFDAFKGRNFYSEPDVSTRVSNSVILEEKGNYITVKDAYENQRGTKGSGLLMEKQGERSKEWIWTNYAEKAKKQYALFGNRFDTDGAITFGENITQPTGDGGYLEDALQAIDSYSDNPNPPPTGAELDNARIRIIPCPAHKNVLATAGDYTRSWANASKNWLDKQINKVIGPVLDDDEGVVKTPRNKWIPEIGREFLQNDIYWYESMITIKKVESNVIGEVKSSVPILTAPPADTFVNHRNSIWTNIRKASTVQFNVQDSNVESERVDIAQSNFVFTEQEGTDAALMENIHAYFSNDGTHNSAIKGIDGSDGSTPATSMLQEVRGQIYCAAPLHIWPEYLEAHPHPYMDIPVKVQLPPAYMKHDEDATKTRMRRALWLGFSRFPINTAYDMGVWWDSSSNQARKGAYGVCLFREGNNNDDQYYSIVSWHDLTSNAGDPYFNNDGKGTNILGYIPRSVIENEYVLFRFAITWDGIKLLCLKKDEEGKYKSVLMYNLGTLNAALSATPVTGSTGADIPTDGKSTITGGKPYITITGHRADDEANSTPHDDTREWTQARKYHIKSGLAGTSGSTDTQYNVWRTGNSPGGDWDAHANCGIDGANSAGLQYMWNPYFTMALTNTRLNADEFAETEVNSGIFGNNKDSISRVYIDSFGAYRFNYSHNNATVNSGNLPRDKIVLPASSSYYYTRPSDSLRTIQSPQNNVDDNEDSGAVSVAHYDHKFGYVSFGFKNKTEAEASLKYIMMNGFESDSLLDLTALEGKTELIDFMYSAEHEPMGEFHWRTYGRDTGDGSATSNRDSSISTSTANSYTGANSTGINVGLPIQMYSFFGTTMLYDGTVPTTHDKDRGDAPIQIWNDAYWPNHQGLIADTDYDLTGNNRVENFSQSGFFSLNWSDDDNTVIGHKIYADNDGISTVTENSSTKYSVRKWGISHNSSVEWSDTGWHAGWGLLEKAKSLSTMSDWVQPNLNWFIKWSADTSTTDLRDQVNLLPAVDSDCRVRMSHGSYSPGTSDHGRLFPGFFVRRENPFVQARILSATRLGGDSTCADVKDPITWSVEIDSPDVLNNADDEIYIVYHAAREWVPSIENEDADHATNHKDHRSESSDIRRQNNYCAALVRVIKETNGTYTLKHCNSSGVIGSNSGDGTTNTANHHNGEDASGTVGGTIDKIIFDTDAMMNTSDRSTFEGTSGETIPRGRFLNSTLCISPWRYWLYLRLPLVDEQKQYMSAIGITSALDNDFSEEAGTDACAFQSTFTESQFSDGTNNANYWSWDPSDLENTKLDVSTDYGFGAFDSQENRGGHIGLGPVQQGQYNQFTCDGVAQAVGSLNPSQKLTIVGFGNENIDAMFKFDSDEGTNKPYVLTSFVDARPTPPVDFAVNPDEETPFFPKFTWETSDDDLWYGLLFVDSKPISNQYHNASLHIPMNEESASTTTTSYYRPLQDSSNTTPTIYRGTDVNNLETRAGYVTVSGATADIEGLAGYAISFDGTNDFLSLADGSYTQPTTDFSINLHLTPDAIPSNNKTILHKLDEFQIELDTNAQIIVKMFPDTAAIPVELKSSTSITCDGVIPTNIIVTLDTQLKYGNLKLFIDGKVEDQSGLKKDVGSKNNWIIDKNLNDYSGLLYIGRDNAGTSTAYYDGKLEELVFYNSVIIPLTPRDQEYTFIKPVSELTTASESVSKAYTGRLFIKDYHNIRGTNKVQVATSSPVSFRKAAFRLRTGDD